MARAVWKGPFVEESLMKKVDKYKDDPKKIPIKTWSRKSTMLFKIGLSFLTLVLILLLTDLTVSTFFLFFFFVLFIIIF